MATIALRVPTALPGQAVLANGQCYILFQRGPHTVHSVIAEKVRAELRKARAGGMNTTSLPLLLPEDTVIGLRPLDEQLAIAQACRAFTTGVFLLLCDGRPLVELDEIVQLDRRTTLLFIHVPAAIAVQDESETRKAA